MKFPIFLAHGEEALVFFAVLILCANVLGLCSVVLALRKKEGVISRLALVLGILGGVCAIGFASLLRWKFERDWLCYGVMILFALSGLGMALSIRKNTPNQPPERTRPGGPRGST
jgi:uncharacterized membrane protein YfcA